MAALKYFKGCIDPANRSQSKKAEISKITIYTRNIYGYKYDQSDSKEEYTVILVGASECGKSTVIDCIANFFMGKKSIDINKRYYVTRDNTGKKDTNGKEAFRFYTFSTKDMVFNFIDSPSINNYSGDVDAKHKSYFQEFIKEMKNGNITVDAVGLVIQNHFNVPLPPAEEKVLRFVTDLVGADISHIIPFITYADANTPPVLEALKAYQIDIKNHLVFNNVCLNPSIDQITEIEHICWRHGLDNVQKGIDILMRLGPIDLLDIPSDEGVTGKNTTESSDIVHEERKEKSDDMDNNDHDYQTAVKHAMIIKECPPNYHNIEVSLKKGKEGFGFDIEGGIDQEEYIPGDNGIYIGKIDKGGALELGGRVYIGDKIIAAKDTQRGYVNFENITHAEALDCIRSFSDPLTMVIRTYAPQSSDVEHHPKPTTNDSTSLPPAPPKSLPSGWEELTDGNGKHYYHNMELGQTQWEYPTIEKVPPKGLSSGWSELTDDNGDTYYHHTASGRTQWECPTPEVTTEESRDLTDHGCNNIKDCIQQCTVKLEENNEIFTGLELRKLIFNLENEDPNNLIRRVSIGKKNCTYPTKAVLLVGATGAGKTSLVSSLVNQAFGIKYKDNFRIKIEEKESEGKTSEESQTEWITVYEFYHIPGMSIDYNLTIIDTPGLNDTKGLHHDRKMFESLEMVLRNKDFGVDELNCIGIVTQASATRLTAGQMYVYEGCMKMFGKDVKRIIHILTTYSDQGSSNIVNGLEKAAVKYEKVHNFNNNIVYLANAKEIPNAIVWKKFMTGTCQDFLNLLKDSIGQSLTQTIETLEKRQLLCKQIKINEEYLLKYLDNASLNLVGANRKMYHKKAFNCTICKITCHKPCHGIEKCEDCKALTEEINNCNKCFCPYGNHKRELFYYVNKNIDLRKENMKKLIKSLKELNECLETLQKVALQPHQESMEEYLGNLIEEKGFENYETILAKYAILKSIQHEENRMENILIDEAELEKLISTIEYRMKNDKVKNYYCKIL